MRGLVARRALRRDGGFTVIELLVSMVLIGILFAAFALLVSSTITHSAVVTNESVLQTQLRVALGQFTKDMREASLPTTGATSPFVTTGGVMSPTQVTFYAPDSTYSTGAPTTYHLREISYQLSGGSFQRASAVSSNTGGPPWTMPALSSYVNQLGGVVNSTVFTYYDGSQPPALTTNPAAVRTVVATITVKVPGTSLQYTYATSATLRETPRS